MSVGQKGKGADFSTTITIPKLKFSAVLATQITTVNLVHEMLSILCVKSLEK